MNFLRVRVFGGGAFPPSLRSPPSFGGAAFRLFWVVLPSPVVWGGAAFLHLLLLRSVASLVLPLGGFIFDFVFVFFVFSQTFICN